MQGRRNSSTVNANLLNTENDEDMKMRTLKEKTAYSNNSTNPYAKNASANKAK